MSKPIIFKGCGTAIATPFTEDGINYSEFERLIEFQIKEGVNAIIVCGTTGESSTMTEEEHKAVIKFAVDVVAKRIPVIAGTGSNNTRNKYRAVRVCRIGWSRWLTVGYSVLQ